jgi:hypothetical protein
MVLNTVAATTRLGLPVTLRGHAAEFQLQFELQFTCVQHYPRRYMHDGDLRWWTFGYAEQRTLNPRDLVWGTWVHGWGPDRFLRQSCGRQVDTASPRHRPSR